MKVKMAGRGNLHLNRDLSYDRGLVCLAKAREGESIWKIFHQISLILRLHVKPVPYFQTT
jgi:hypothetical protein